MNGCGFQLTNSVNLPYVSFFSNYGFTSPRFITHSPLYTLFPSLKFMVDAAAVSDGTVGYIG